MISILRLYELEAMSTLPDRSVWPKKARWLKVPWVIPTFCIPFLALSWPLLLFDLTSSAATPAEFLILNSAWDFYWPPPQVQDRTRQIIQNLEAVLKGANMTLKNVVKANIYLSNLSRDFDAINEVRQIFLYLPGDLWLMTGNGWFAGLQGDDAWPQAR
jgi:hypothetical protein